MRQGNLRGSGSAVKASLPNRGVRERSERGWLRRAVPPAEDYYFL